MKRRLFNVLAAVSLVLAVASADLWYRSQKWRDSLTVHLSGAAGLNLETEHDAVSVAIAEFDITPGAVQIHNLRPIGSDPNLREQYLLDGPDNTWRGFGWDNDRTTGEVYFKGLTPLKTYSLRIAVPLWCSTFALFLLPSCSCVRAVARAARAGPRAVRATENRCRICGYDLRATPERCPECGTAVGPVA